MIECCKNRAFPSLAHVHARDVPRTWIAQPVRMHKAQDEEDAAAALWLLSLADRLLPRVRAAFLAAIDRLRGSADIEAVRAAIATGDPDAVVTALGLGAELPAGVGAALTHPLEDLFAAAGRAAPDHIPPEVLRQLPGAVRPIGPSEIPRPPLQGGSMQMRFDLTNPNSVRFLRDYDMGLIKQVSEETRTAIRRVVQNAITGGGPIPKQAKQIMDLVGLTDRQAQAATNYRAALVEEGRPDDQVDRMAEKYSRALLRRRAETIARTETIRASNAGQQASWQQAQAEGMLSATAKRQWIVTPDDRLCVYCAAVPALNAGGVALDGLFMTPLGPVAYPPLHPNCRCTTTLFSL